MTDSESLRLRRQVLAATLVVASLLAAMHLDRASSLVVDEQPWVTMDEPLDAAEKLIINGDGQFFSMLARDPSLSRPADLNGIVDEEGQYAYRAMRPAFAWAAWVTSAGQPGAAAWALVALTVASVVALAAAVMTLADAAGRGPETAALVIVLPGVLHLLGWTGPEVAAAACACWGVAAAIRGRERRAAGWLVAAVLLRETLLLVVAALVVARLLRWGALAPLAALTAWLLVVRVRVGAWPSGGGRFELGGIASAANTWDRNALLGLVLLAVLIVLAWRNLPAVVGSLLLVHVVLGAVMDDAVWSADGFPRVLLPLYAVLLGLAGSVRSDDVPRQAVTPR